MTQITIIQTVVTAEQVCCKKTSNTFVSKNTDLNKFLEPN